MQVLFKLLWVVRWPTHPSTRQQLCIALEFSKRLRKCAKALLKANQLWQEKCLWPSAWVKYCHWDKLTQPSQLWALVQQPNLTFPESWAYQLCLVQRVKGNWFMLRQQAPFTTHHWMNLMPNVSRSCRVCKCRRLHWQTIGYMRFQTPTTQARTRKSSILTRLGASRMAQFLLTLPWIRVSRASPRLASFQSRSE